MLRALLIYVGPAYDLFSSNRLPLELSQMIGRAATLSATTYGKQLLSFWIIVKNK
jgi:hypothetical protein